MNKEPTCYECAYLKDTFGNYVECMLYAENNPLSHMFVDYWYWGHGAPNTCPLKTASKKDTTQLSKRAI